MLFLSKTKTDNTTVSKYQMEVSKLVEERKAISSVLPFIEDPEMYSIYFDKLGNIDKELGYYTKKAQETNERNDNIYAFATISNHQETFY
jgi:hypothetical protein